MSLSREISNTSTLKITTDTLAAGLTLTPKLDAIAAIVSGGFVAPSIRRFGLRFNMVVNVGAAGGPMRFFLDCFNSIVCRDMTGERINWISGLEWRNKLQQWYGNSYHDGPDLAPGNSQTISQTFWLPFVPWNVVRDADFYIPATDIFSGFLQATFLGNGASTFGPASTFTFVSGTVDYIVEIVEEGRLEAKSRIVHRSLAVISPNSTYPVGSGGTVFDFDYWNGRTNQLADTPYAAQNITSNTLRYNNIPSAYLRDAYFQTHLPRWQDGGPVGGDQQDPHQFGNLLPIFVKGKFAGIVDMPLLATLHYQTDGSVNTATDRLELTYIEGRSDAQTASQLRVTQGNIRDIINVGGVLPHGNGKKTKASGLDWDMLSRAAIRLDPDVAKANRVSRQ